MVHNILSLDLISLAIKSLHPKSRHAAIILYKDEIVCWSNNLPQRLGGKHKYDHAEVRAIAIAKIKGYTTDLTLVSIAIDKQNKLKLAKPCATCMKYCNNHGVKVIFYSTQRQIIVRMP